jgi:hypothetical protein
MLDRIRDEIRSFLAAYETGILCLAGEGHPWAMPVPYRLDGLQIRCRVPRWADGSYYLETDPRCVLLVPAAGGVPCWVSYTARACRDPDPDWADWPPEPVHATRPADLYTILRLQPLQIDLFDERQGWGARQTLEP